MYNKRYLKFYPKKNTLSLGFNILGSIVLCRFIFVVVIFILYTSYISKLKKIPDDIVKICVMRYPSINCNKYNLKHFISLSPKDGILKKYKNDKNFTNFKENFIKQILNDEEALKSLRIIAELSKHCNICLICCEKDFKFCHRSILSSIIYKLVGVECREF